METVGAWVEVEMERERSLSGGDALLMASALRVVIQQRLAGPCFAASCWINAVMEGRARRRVVGRLSEESVILRKRARPDCQSSGRASRPVDLALLDTPAPSL
jgi:hypothetical protein